MVSKGAHISNRIILCTTSMVLSIVVAAFSLSAQAQAASLFQSAKDQACSGAQQVDDTTCAGGGGQLRVENIIKAALNLLSIVAGIAAVIMIVIAGIRYVTSSGDSNGVSGAKNTIIYAIVGLVIVALSQLIVRFVINRLS